MQIYKVFIKNFFIAIGDCDNSKQHGELISQSCSCFFCQSSFDEDNTITQISKEPLLYNYLDSNSYHLNSNLIIRSIHYNEIFQSFKKKYSYIIAAGGVVLNEKDEVLMIFKNNTWDLPKGKKDLFESDFHAAVREVHEETNIKSSSFVDGPFSTYHMYSIAKEKTQKNMILKETRWFLMYASSQEKLKPQFEESIQDVAWVTKIQLKKMNIHNSLKSVFNYFLN